MKVLISYDLDRVEDTDGLNEFIKKKFPSCWHGLDATWIISSTYSPVQIRDSVKHFFKSDDGLLVLDVSGSLASWSGFGLESSGWLKGNL